MMTITTMITVTMMITIALTIMLNMVAKKSFMDREKMSPFECGFDPKSKARLPFSLQFFLIAIMFLIFDVEITLLFPLTTTMKFTSPLMHSLSMLIIILILISGLIHEWTQGALNWTK